MDKKKCTTTAKAPSDNDESEGQRALERTFRDKPLSPAIAIVDGRGCHVGVSRGELLLRDGLGRYRRERRYSKVGHGLRRLLVLGDASLTTAALRWCESTGVAVAVLGPDTELLVTSATGIDDARIRRQQAIAGTNQIGLSIAKCLLGAKVLGHVQIARNILVRPDAAAAIQTFAEALEGAESLDECRSLEATCAEVYWRAWVDNPATTLRFARGDVSRGRIPSRWTQFDGRRSLIGSGNSNKRSERPLNSLLHLGYRLAEIEIRILCAAIGVDFSLGVVHLDRARRDGMVLDVLEVARPAVESFTLDLVSERVFRRSDFHEALDGAVKVLPPLTHDVAAAMTSFGQMAAPYIEQTRNMLAEGIETKIDRPTPLTGASRRNAAARVKARKMAQVLAVDRASAQARHRKPAVTAARLGGPCRLRINDQQAPQGEVRRLHRRRSTPDTRTSWTASGRHLLPAQERSRVGGGGSGAALGSRLLRQGDPTPTRHLQAPGDHGDVRSCQKHSLGLASCATTAPSVALGCIGGIGQCKGLGPNKYNITH